MNNSTKFIAVDLFCGAGGTTTGLVQSGLCEVVAAVNHDPYAIASHSANHSGTEHFNEDVRAYDMLTRLHEIVEAAKQRHPLAKVVLWASMECTNFSNAKGGKPREQDSRTLANVLFWYVEALNPDYVWFENVREFMAWGPLDENGKPLSRKKGRDYMKWVSIFEDYGYEYNSALLNSADFGAYTSRVRLFGIFAKKGLPMKFPLPTHSKSASQVSDCDMFAEQKKPWLPVKDVLDLDKYGASVFLKPKADKTLLRIIRGIEKFANEGQFMMYYFGTGDNTNSINEPCRTVMVFENCAICHFITNPQFRSNGHSVNVPAPTVVASQKSFPLGLTSVIKSEQATESSNWIEQPGDSEIMKQLRQVCKAKNIVDVFSRMLTYQELQNIQGFPSNYKLMGSTSERKKQLGNAVIPIIPKMIAQAIATNL